MFSQYRYSKLQNATLFLHFYLLINLMFRDYNNSLTQHCLPNCV